MLSMLIAYDDNGNVVATLDYMVSMDAEGNVIGLVDFDAQEKAGEMTEVWNVEGAKGSKVWPEWLGSRAHDFRVELEGPPGQKRIASLIHKQSGHRRERSVIESAIAEKIASANGKPADIRDIVGGPNKPLRIGDDGKVLARQQTSPPRLPVVSRKNLSSRR
jgi:hypothetical protein